MAGDPFFEIVSMIDMVVRNQNVTPAQAVQQIESEILRRGFDPADVLKFYLKGGPKPQPGAAPSTPASQAKLGTARTAARDAFQRLMGALRSAPKVAASAGPLLKKVGPRMLKGGGAVGAAMLALEALRWLAGRDRGESPGAVRESPSPGSPIPEDIVRRIEVLPSQVASAVLTGISGVERGKVPVRSLHDVARVVRKQVSPVVGGTFGDYGDPRREQAMFNVYTGLKNSLGLTPEQAEFVMFRAFDWLPPEKKYLLRHGTATEREWDPETLARRRGAIVRKMFRELGGDRSPVPVQSQEIFPESPVPVPTSMELEISSPLLGSL